ncbi:MAG TPA: diphosphomevalonate decarboxylase [Patescibacteria group bacterium]
MKKIRVKSPANIAFIKYWGQRDKNLVLPFNDSFSMNLSGCYTTLEIENKENSGVKELYIKNYQEKAYKKADQKSLEKVIDFYQKAKEFLKEKDDFGFIIKSANSFPKKAGIASSASFFAGLALGFSKLFEVDLGQKELSILARLSGSGSACRSIPDGFSWWHKGKNSQTSYAESIASCSFWDLVDLVLILSKEEKRISSQEGHQRATTSPFFKFRLLDLKRRVKEIKKVFQSNDFSYFGRLIEEEAISMHTVMMTQNPPLYYWSGKTIEIIEKTVELRKQGVEIYYTVDAGENVHIICQKKDEKKAFRYFQKQPEVLEIIKNYPAIGARIINE